MASTDSTTIAVCQLNCTSDRKKNFETCKNFINLAAARHAKMVFFPECFDHVGESRNQSIQLAEPLEGALISDYRQLATQNSIWLSLGGFHEKGSSVDQDKVYNSHILINSSGDIAAVYRKIHLFDIDVPGGVRLKESDYTIPGKEVLPPVDTPVGKIGLGICYDLRFPEFSLAMTESGAEILTYPSAFTQVTGMAHWEAMLRSRAIESQCYVVAAAQTGKHNPKRTSYGHAMVVDPWGCVIACCSEGVGIAFAEINMSYLKNIRRDMPIWKHRRSELYGSLILPEISDGSDSSYTFANIKLRPEHIFYKTKHSIAIVNKGPLLPGHVLVIPIRVAKRLSDLFPYEVADLFTCVQIVQAKIEEAFKTTSSTVAIQDGPEAGQTIPHVHVHIVPRKAGDFEKNDDIYKKLEEHDKAGDRKWRTPEEMTEEADKLRKYF
ncbi:nitrilase and fragile histidine triad fusion protein NitFhit isoform X2 [Parasteatoda tepidariorum]|nr:nitrilase and fragile histidine triad fusion protein NitFhit isoform X2 [Parasteatoda tepidariorum]XP_042909541.1 nitrilase and fragile histidine triad fusion protein NitFhit isoform X2 [Parasteatoda tepidariorum]XP_042909542.1 nitrilase and fragile histidine triad fusion protein NitFhit isoform X2 [Parasteatoda tepidariorum]